MICGPDRHTYLMYAGLRETLDWCLFVSTTVSQFIASLYADFILPVPLAILVPLEVYTPVSLFDRKRDEEQHGYFH